MEVIITWSLVASFTCGINGLIIAAILCNKDLRKRRTIPVLSLALADFCVGVFILPAHMIEYSTSETSTFPRVYCMSSTSVTVFVTFSCLLNILAITMDRAFLVLYPIRYKVFMSAKKTTVCFLIVWTVALVTGLLSMINMKQAELSESDRSFFYVTCLRKANRGIMFAWIFLVSVTLIVLVITYTIVLRQAGSNRKRVGSHMTPYNSKSSLRRTESTLSNASVATTLSQISQISGMGSERRLTTTAILVVSVFFLLWTPHLIVTIIAITTDCPKCLPNWVEILTTTLTLMNSGTNGILYSLRMHDIRAGIHAVLTCRCNKHDFYNIYPPSRGSQRTSPNLPRCSKTRPSPLSSTTPPRKRKELPKLQLARSCPATPSMSREEPPNLLRTAIANNWQRQSALAGDDNHESSWENIESPMTPAPTRLKRKHHMPLRPSSSNGIARLPFQGNRPRTQTQ